MVSVCLPSCNTYRLTWVSFTLDVGYLFTAAPAKHSCCSLPWEGLGAGGEGDDRGWDGWMASLTRWMRVWVNFGSWWWTGRPCVLRFMRSRRVGHDWVTELNWTEAIILILICWTPDFSGLCCLQNQVSHLALALRHSVKCPIFSMLSFLTSLCPILNSQIGLILILKSISCLDMLILFLPPGTPFPPFQLHLA